jgi:hypothetical protein
MTIGWKFVLLKAVDSVLQQPRRSNRNPNKDKRQEIRTRFGLLPNDGYPEVGKLSVVKT